MASLKDMRVRIAATKATQKITKAMQMVAASKLRRAQAAAEAARPYAEHMDAVLRNIAGSVKGLDAAPALLRTRNADILDDIRQTSDLTDATAGKLKAAVDGYARTFA